MNYFFSTERLVFRHWKEEDRELFFRMNSDPDVMEFFPKTLNREESGRFMDRINKVLHEKNYGLWAIERKLEKDWIGFIGLNDTSFQADFTPCVEIGWRLKKDVWGKGYAGEGARAVLKYGFQTIGLESIYSFTSVLNLRSERVMQKIGMTKAGEFDHPNIEDGNALKRHVLYKMERRDSCF